jgi:hypothetical protein
MSKESEKSRHIGGKPATRDEARNRKTLDKPPAVHDKGEAVKPKDGDVGDLKRDR